MPKYASMARLVILVNDKAIFRSRENDVYFIIKALRDV